MNIDSDEIMLFSSQCASEIVREYAMLSELNGLSTNLGFLTSEISEYLCKDNENAAVRKCAVTWQVGVLVAQARRVPNLSGNIRAEAVEILNDLHKNFVSHCESHEKTLFHIQNTIQTPTRSMKM